MVPRHIFDCQGMYLPYNVAVSMLCGTISTQYGVKGQPISIWGDSSNVLCYSTGRRGGREAYGAALEKRFPTMLGRGFKSHPLRHCGVVWSTKMTARRDAGVVEQARLEIA